MQNLIIRTILFKVWYTYRKTYTGLHDQNVFEKIKCDPFIKEIGLQPRYLNTAFFGGFCQPCRDLHLVCTIHENCSVGMQNNIHDLQILL